jgi:hypothetical protein
MTVPTIQEPILVIGDSLTAAAEGELHDAARSDGITLHVRAEPGRHIRAAVPIMEATTRYSEVVLALGTNDVDAPAPLVIRTISEVLASVGRRRVLWVDVGLADMSRAAQINAALEQAAREHPQLDLVRWSRHAMANPSLLSADGVHLTGGGRLAFAAIVSDGIRRHP